MAIGQPPVERTETRQRRKIVARPPAADTPAPTVEEVVRMVQEQNPVIMAELAE